jgi:DNA polymerase-3 subunit epsilon
MTPSDMNLERVICFDVESTGFASTDGIIEIGAVEYIYGQRTGVLFQSYIKPTVPVNHHAAEVHGLTNMMLASAPPAKLVIPSFLSWVGSSPLVAHNARFDMRMLQQEANRLGLGDTLKEKPVFCTMRSYRKLYPGRPYALIDLYTALLGAERYASNSQICNPKLPNHSAIVDCEILGEIFLKLAEESLLQCLPPS